MEAIFAPLRRYADFDGRSNRKEFWLFMLGLFLVSLVIDFLSSLLPIVVLASHAAYGNALAVILRVVPMVLRLGFFFSMLVPSLAVLIRRLHDTDRSGWWTVLLIPVFPALMAGGLMGFIVHQSYFGNARAAWGLLVLLSPLLPYLKILSFVALIAAFVLFVLTVLKGTEDANRFGPSSGKTSQEDDVEHEQADAPIPDRAEQSHAFSPPLSPPVYRTIAERAAFGKRR